MQEPRYISRRNGEKYRPKSRAKRIEDAIQMKEEGPMQLFSEVNGQVYSV